MVDPDASDSSLLLEATRRLLWAADVEAVLATARDLVRDLGGSLLPAGATPVDAIPVDLALGTGTPVLPTAAPGSSAREALERQLPLFVRDAHRALELLDRSQRFADEATRDPLTGLWNRRMVTRLLPRVHEGSVVVVDLDHFKLVNDSSGHHAGDRVLRDFARALSETARTADYVARTGGEEFLVVLRGPEPDPFLERLRKTWEATRQDLVTFSAGTALVLDRAEDAVIAADRALYRAKGAGRDRWCPAEPGDYP
ncbi:GGDEF domain-containing protein [Nocardioides houyundeii]|uniref:GGDEF domain-containing protein n=1 Tax=Nocardioides houyundeii TaxID=2045452 RepID=UPI000C7782D1|nr:GGDEF domain-containing protein [Nocardioides houyundeii]